ncbi:MAG TPA: N-acyl homoserine lactonase family protein [Thermodesulfobacteriota bacterium]|nr:N-acyl homoserine lactonase family protein [Thermodesulfobacteriota bacterium]
MAIPTYEIYALKYGGPYTRPASMVNWFQDIDKNIQINYYIFAIRGERETLVVDCGVDPELAKARNLAGYVNPAEVLKRLDIDAQKLKYLVVSHIHFDHISGIKLFPRARIFVQEKEYNFWMKNPIARRAPFLHVTDPEANRYLAKLEGKKRLELIRGDKKILPGIELLLVPGHTIGLQAVAVHTAKGTAVVGSDLAHTFSSYRTDIPSAIITDMITWMKSYDKIKTKASSPDLLFPGHDLALLENYPKVAEDVSRLV